MEARRLPCVAVLCVYERCSWERYLRSGRSCVRLSLFFNRVGVVRACGRVLSSLVDRDGVAVSRVSWCGAAVRAVTGRAARCHLTAGGRALRLYSGPGSSSGGRIPSGLLATFSGLWLIGGGWRVDLRRPVSVCVSCVTAVSERARVRLFLVPVSHRTLSAVFLCESRRGDANSGCYLTFPF